MMESSWPENDRKRRMVKELVQGQECASQLRYLLNEDKENDGSINIEDLVVKVQKSFINSLIILNNGEFDEVSQIPTNSQLDSPCWDSRKSDDSGESIKSSKLKDRRGCYKRRKCSRSWTSETPNLIDDGLAWRKYGQKVILNAKYPRNYFRCTHRHDQGCQAKKQVQRIEEDPPKYRTMYYGYHSCKALLKPSQLLLDSTSNDSSILLRFDTNITNKQYHDDFVFQSSSPKEEHKDVVIIPSDDMIHDQSASSDYIISPDSTNFDHVTLLSYDHGDVISGQTTSTHSFDMGVIVESDDFVHDIFEFEFN
ncbi:WRKY domain-containing protein [Cephalotus follicularis]|uniref:WRKY domain-containing protein n=1 Tax=Cephalotus follicularis TaxID=3775 RepID=A0A1Q3BR12_CEPFO|nr:WRKY domain-containing protein [Cephalotus follicularis]